MNYSINIPKYSIEDYTFLVYAPPKAGKTTSAALTEGGCLILDNEGGAKHIPVYREVINDWIKFKSVVNDILSDSIKGTLPFKAIAIDTLDTLLRQCVAYIGRENKTKPFVHQSELGYTLGYKLVQLEFMSALQKLSACPQFSLWLTCHAKEYLISSGKGQDSITYTAYKPFLEDNIWQLVAAMVDFIFFINKDQDTGMRTICSKETRRYYAEGRVSLPSPISISVIKNGVIVPTREEFDLLLKKSISEIPKDLISFTRRSES